MRDMSHSDHPSEDPDGEAGFKPTPRQIIGVLVAIVLVVFIAVNSEDASVSLIVTTVNMPLWLVLAITALVGVGIGMMLGSRRAKAKLRG